MQSIAVLIGRRIQKLRKDVANVLASEFGNNLCPTRPVLYSFEDSPGETAERQGGARMGLSGHQDVVWSGQLEAGNLT